MLVLSLFLVQAFSAQSAVKTDSLPPRFQHPGLLHTQSDFKRMQGQVADRIEPWAAGWKRLTDNSHAALTWVARPVDTVYRGTGTPENYGQLYNDIAAAYAMALRWKVSGDTNYAQASIAILNAWSSRLKKIDGTSDRFLAAGIYGYEIANVAEIMRTYAGWGESDFIRFQNMLRDVFYPLSHDFLLNHNNACISHYWANWDLVSMAAVLAIGVVIDDTSLFFEAVDYFKNGAGNGSISHVIWKIHPNGLGQWQESGRDQGHTLLGIALLGAICEMAWNQGEDLYGYDDNRLLKGVEYVAKYNLGDSVPFSPYDNCDKVNQIQIAPASRGELRPGWELLYNHYVGRRGLTAPNTKRFAALVRPEGGGGDYGPNSGGYDQLGYGTLTSTLMISMSPLFQQQAQFAPPNFPNWVHPKNRQALPWKDDGCFHLINGARVK
jgi:hypothetical protein